MKRLFIVFLMALAVAVSFKLIPLLKTKTTPTVVKSNVEEDLQDTEKVAWPRPSSDGSKTVLFTPLTAKNYYVVFDGSASMTDKQCSGDETKAVVAKRAVGAFAKSIPADANLGLFVFDGRGASERVPLGLGKANRDHFLSEISSVSPEGVTPLETAVRLASEKLEAQARNQLGYGEYHLVVVTDGEASSGEDPRKSLSFILKNTPIVVHTLGFCIGANHSLNQKGRTLYQAANNPEELQRGLEDVLAESPDFDVKEFRGSE